MKNLLMTLVLVLSTMRLVAQTTDNQHLMFKGVPIDGTMSEYVAKMKLNGFVVVATESGLTELEGDFASYKKCRIIVATVKGKDLVSKIHVSFPTKQEWSDLEFQFNNLKEMLMSKYGSPSQNISEWLSNGEPENTMKTYYIKNDECRFISTFQTPKGEIQLKIDHKSLMCFISLTYTDKINGEIMKAKAIDDL